MNAQGGVNTPAGQNAIRPTGFVVNPDIKTQYSESWFLNLQREIWKGWIVEVGYTGTRGVNLERIDDVNRFAGDLLDGKEDRINPNFSTLLYVTNGVDSIYHGMTLKCAEIFPNNFHCRQIIVGRNGWILRRILPPDNSPTTPNPAKAR